MDKVSKEKKMPKLAKKSKTIRILEVILKKNS